MPKRGSVDRMALGSSQEQMFGESYTSSAYSKKFLHKTLQSPDFTLFKSPSKGGHGRGESLDKDLKAQISSFDGRNHGDIQKNGNSTLTAHSLRKILASQEQLPAV